MKLLEEKIISLIDRAPQIFLVGHKKPDGDVLGAICSLIAFLEKRKKNHYAFCQEKDESIFSFLPFVEKIKSDFKEVNLDKEALILVLDCGDLKQTGLEDFLKNKKVINIDHHFTNEMFGYLNLVNQEASSTCEILYSLLRAQIDQKMAVCLLTGILEDTGKFVNAATTFNSLKISSDLLLLGASLKNILRHLEKGRTLKSLRLWGRVLSRLSEHKETGIVSAIILKQDFIDFDLKEEDLEGLVNFFNSLSSAKAVFVLREKEKGEIKISLRTINPLIDVSRLARFFGGGGHQKAAGFTLHGYLRETEKGWILT